MLSLPLTPQKTYVYYDGPQVFSAADATGQLYLAMAVSETDAGEAIFLAACVSAHELMLLEKGVVDMREAFFGEGGYRFTYAHNTSVQVQHIVPQSWLPHVGVKLLEHPII